MKTGLYAIALFLVAGLALILISKHVPTGLPHRAPTGNHGQGNSEPTDCPGRYREPVELDGLEFPLTCWGAQQIAAFVGRGHKDTQPQTFTVSKVVALEMTADGKWGPADLVTVPAKPGYDPLVCFRLNGTPVLQCLYIGDDGATIQEDVHADPERT